VAKKPIRNSISWDAINTAKCVYGGSGDKTIVVDGLTYKVRLLKGGANKDPAGAYNGGYLSQQRMEPTNAANPPGGYKQELGIPG